MFSAPPPTTHSLPKPQRLRLMRSTRKLAAILGAAPLLVDPREPIPPVPRGSPITPTIDAVLDAAPEKPLLEPVFDAASSVRPTLLLRINTAPSGANRPRAMSQSWGRPMSAGASLGSPVSVSSFDSEEDGKQAAVQAERRRKMARVARTLGDGVPIELVFHQNERRRKSEEEMEKAKISLEAEEDSEPRAVTFSPSAYTWEQRSDTPSSSRPSTASAGERASVALTIRRSSSLLFKEKNIPRSATVRTEVGWTGEWNRDGTSVVKGLRALK